MKFWRTKMAYTQQIKILEEKLKQLGKGPFTADNIQRTLTIQGQISKLKKLEWEEKFERINMDEDR